MRCRIQGPMGQRSRVPGSWSYLCSMPIKLIINWKYDVKTRQLPKFMVGPSIIIAKKKNYIQKNIFQKGLAKNLFFYGCESWSRVHSFAQWWQGYLKFGEDLSWGIRINIRFIVLLIKKKFLRKNLLARPCLPIRKINRLPLANKLNQ